MTGIFPNKLSGGIVVRDSDGEPIHDDRVDNGFIPPSGFNVSCELTYLPSDCTARFEPRQANAIVSELLCLAFRLSPEGGWDCENLCNLSSSFSSWIESDEFFESVRNSICQIDEDQLNDGDKIIFCGDDGVRKADFYQAVTDALRNSYCSMEGDELDLLSTTRIAVCSEGRGVAWSTLSDLKGHIHVFSLGDNEDEIGIVGDGSELNPIKLSQKTIDKVNASRTYDTKSSVESDSIPLSVNSIIINGYNYAGDGGEAIYKRASMEPLHSGKVQSADGAWWVVADNTINILSFGAVGDGVHIDDDSFVALEAVTRGAEIDLLGRTYAVTQWPVKNLYSNGIFIRQGVKTRIAPSGGKVKVGSYDVLIGDRVAPNVDTFGSTYALIGIGYGCLENANATSRQQIAIGRNVLKDSVDGTLNIGIGLDALMHLNGNGVDGRGTRNTAIGDNSMRFSETAARSIAIGRNALHTNLSGPANTVVGVNAHAGYGPISFNGEIVNQFNSDVQNSTAIGFRALEYTRGNHNTAVGSEAGTGLSNGERNVLVGRSAGVNLDSTIGMMGGVLTNINKDASYSQVGTVLTITLADHGVAVGDIVRLQFTTPIGSTISGDHLFMPVATANTGSFTVISDYAGNFTGSLRVVSKETAARAPTASSYNVAIGNEAMGSTTGTPSQNVAVGSGALRSVSEGSNVGVGYRAFGNLATGNNNTALGRDAGYVMQDGSNASTVYGSTCIGSGSSVSGNNQVQLGDSNTTTYTYGAVQNRSDERDKADVRDTILGLDFINALRPVDYRWDMRDDYFEINDAGDLTKLSKDGSKKRTRYHHGLLAQELRDAMNSLGVDFGGFQDHSVNGGNDVLSIGYSELIAPLIKAIQELSIEIIDLKNRVID